MKTKSQSTDIHMQNESKKNDESKKHQFSDDEKLTRIHKPFDILGVPDRGRGKYIAQKLGISRGMVSRYLSGTDTLSNNFLKSVSNCFGISSEYITSGGGDVLTKTILISPPPGVVNVGCSSGNIGVIAVRDSIVKIIVSFFNDYLLASTEADTLRFYADILEAKKLVLIKKDDGEIEFYNPVRK